MLALKYVQYHNKQNNCPTDDRSVWDTLQGEEEIAREEICQRRWWRDDFVVVKIGKRLIGRADAYSTHDSCPSDLGWEPDMDSICFVEEYEETIVQKKYRKVFD